MAAVIRVEGRPRQLAVPGAEPVVLEVWPGGRLRVRLRGTRTWYETTAGAVIWLAAKAAAEAERRRRDAERKARRAAGLAHAVTGRHEPPARSRLSPLTGARR